MPDVVNVPQTPIMVQNSPPSLTPAQERNLQVNTERWRAIARTNARLRGNTMEDPDTLRMQSSHAAADEQIARNLTQELERSISRARARVQREDPEL